VHGERHGATAAHSRTAWHRRSSACGMSRAHWDSAPSRRGRLRRRSARDLSRTRNNRARSSSEYFMIAANTVVGAVPGAPRPPASLRRVLRRPERWGDRRAGAGTGERLPAAPDARALSAFSRRRQQAAPAQFPDLSLVDRQVAGGGEYVLKRPEQAAEGHFGLAVDDYTHATAPTPLPGPHHSSGC